MTKFNHELVVEKLDKLAKIEAGLSDAHRKEFVFHMSDWLNDFESLAQAYQNVSGKEDRELYDALLQFLIHVPNHLNEAAKIFLMDDDDD